MAYSANSDLKKKPTKKTITITTTTKDEEGRKKTYGKGQLR